MEQNREVRRTLIRPQAITSKTIYMIYTGMGESLELHGVYGNETKAGYFQSKLEESSRIETKSVTRLELEAVLEKTFLTHSAFEKWGVV